jgi:tetratricopeptide (TPR) repeat protein
MNILLILIIVISNSFSFTDKQMLDARSLYDAGKFKEALEKYREVETSLNEDNSSLLFNIGNTYYRLGSLGYAKAYYLKALRMEPRNSDFLHNFYIVNIKLGIHQEKGFLLRFVNFLSLDELALLSYFLFVALVAFFFVFILLKRKGKTFIGSVSLFAFGSFLIFFIFVLSIIFIKKEIIQKESGVVVSSATLRAAPSDTSTALVDLPLGDSVMIEKGEGSWYKISYDDNFIGWVKKEKIMEI